MKPLAFLAAVLALSLVGCASAPPKPAKPKNLALGIEGVANNHILDFVATNAFDGDTASYWEGAANQYPNTLTVDLGKKVAVKEFVLKLNPRRLWAARTQTIEIQSSDNGSDFTTIVPKADYQFDPIDGGNLVTVPVKATAEWFRLVFTANTEATAGQLAEWEIHS
jgi:hypothetical protein